jgi:hypothetical protein
MKYSCLITILFAGVLFAAGDSIFLYNPTHTDTGVWLVGGNNDVDVINAGESVGSYLPATLADGIYYFGDNEASYGPYLGLPSNPTTPLLGDIDGDGQVNPILKGLDSSGNEAVMAPWTTRPVGSEALTFALLNADNVAVFAGDVNADGTDDIIARNTANDFWMAYHCDPNGLAGTPDTWRPGNSAGNYMFVGDFNGDGATDVGEYRTSDAMVFGWLSVPQVGLSDDSDLYFEYNLQAYNAGLMGFGTVDLNGDGLDDLVEFVDNGSSWICKLYITQTTENTPAGYDFSAAYSWASLAKNASATNHQLIVADIDGDGFGDLVQYEEFTGIDGNTSARLRVVYGDGNITNATEYDAWQLRSRQEIKEYSYGMIFGSDVSGFIVMAGATDTDPAKIVGDLNDDGVVDPLDVTELAAMWLDGVI